jgi:uncharacterized protein (DUF1800 family)
MTQHPSPFARRLAGVLTAGALLSLYTGGVTAQRQTASLPPADAWTSMHVLNRIGYGARPGDLERVQKMGLAAYIEEQLHPERINNAALDTRLAEFTTLKLDSREITETFIQPAQQLQRQRQLAQGNQPPRPQANAGDPNMMTDAPPARPQLTAAERQIRQGQQSVVQDLMQAKIIRAVESDRQLEEVLTDFWFNHFNVFIEKGQVRQYITEYEREAIRPHVLGKFRDMLGATAHSPAMLFYLDNFQSSSPNAQQQTMAPEMVRRLNNPRLGPAQRQQLMQRLQQAQRQRPSGLNENYARELMELHTLGVDGGYTQKDVQEVARALTGWTIARPGLTFEFRPQMHDSGSKEILGVKFDGRGGQSEGERVLDMLAKHPSTAHHIAFKLAQRFVADDPPATLVDRAAKVFLDTKGDLREVTRTIITSPEMFDSDTYRAKVKTPFEFVVSALRATGATVTNAQPIVQQLRGPLGMPLYGCQPPTGYSMTADAWVNTGALLNRMNFAVSLVGDGGRGMLGQPAGRGQGGGAPQRAALQGFARPGQIARGPLQVELENLAPDVTEASRDRLVALILAGRASDSTTKTLSRAEAPQQLVALTLGSPEFQRR